MDKRKRVRGDKGSLEDDVKVRNLPRVMSLSTRMPKKVLFACLVVISCYLLCHGTISSFAMDQAGCLTCHRYTGLVRFEKPDRFKVLYIDEPSFLKSPHGKIDCRKCHTKIVKVPHTGETGVECNTACHKTEKEHVQVKNYPLENFHKDEQSAITSFEDVSSCGVCHALYPHSENIMVRALLNMHTVHMICEVCHIKRDNFYNLVYERKEAERFEFSGGSYRSRYVSEMRTIEKPGAGFLISRIAVFVADGGSKRIIMNTRDTDKASEFMLKEQTLTQNERDEQLGYFHKDVARKEIGIACDECHSTESILNFAKLGFDEKETNNLTHLNLKGLVTKYKIFYFPDLFGR